MGWLDLQRLATALVMPLSLGLLLGLIGLALAWRARGLGLINWFGCRWCATEARQRTPHGLMREAITDPPLKRAVKTIREGIRLLVQQPTWKT
ncbi:MAG: hypothetical protein VBE63_25385 [Lamprobacter sp.]|uniref:hypothetical protein n=1 Tax=Lamprobacter sp. TaxID=3100796 RepID=UPI002B260018|nr:hypothetical protein [Lamprobacter sp.]MEA3643242.1 hypothetical protein [Lamprobacter sp.]